MNVNAVGLWSRSKWYRDNRVGWDHDSQFSHNKTCCTNKVLFYTFTVQWSSLYSRVSLFSFYLNNFFTNCSYLQWEQFVNYLIKLSQYIPSTLYYIKGQTFIPNFIKSNLTDKKLDKTWLFTVHQKKKKFWCFFLYCSKHSIMGFSLMIWDNEISDVTCGTRK